MPYDPKDSPPLKPLAEVECLSNGKLAGAKGVVVADHGDADTVTVQLDDGEQVTSLRTHWKPTGVVRKPHAPAAAAPDPTPAAHTD